MYARVISLLVKEGKLDDVAALLRETIIPEAHEQQGFHRAEFLTDTRTGTCILISYWETEEDMLASRASGFYDRQIDRIRHVRVQE
jgi:quinol monooxygenase YgiN